MSHTSGIVFVLVGLLVATLGLFRVGAAGGWRTWNFRFRQPEVSSGVIFSVAAGLALILFGALELLTGGL